MKIIELNDKEADFIVQLINSLQCRVLDNGAKHDIFMFDSKGENVFDKFRTIWREETAKELNILQELKDKFK